MKLWPWFGVAGFLLLGAFLRVWQSRNSAMLWLRTWAIWTLACILGAVVSSRFLQSLRLAPTTWHERWALADWQLQLWFLSSLPATLFVALDLKSEQGGFQRSLLAAAAGLALGPLLLGAFPLDQMAAFFAPYFVLALASRFMPGSRMDLYRALLALALLNSLGFAHGLFNLPAWLGSMLLAACLAIGLNPYSRPAAGMATALAACAVALKLWLNLPALVSLALTCLLIAGGWLLKSIPLENDRAQTA